MVAPVAKETKFSCLPASRNVSSLCEYSSKEMVCFMLFKDLQGRGRGKREMRKDMQCCLNSFCTRILFTED